MTATSSTCPQVRAWLIDGLKVRLPSSVRVTRSKPLQTRAESVWLGGSGSATSTPHDLGPATINRLGEYLVNVVFVCQVRTADDDAEDRVFQRFAELERLLAENPKPAIEGLLDLVLARWEFKSIGPEGPTSVEIEASVRAREHTS